MAAGRGSRPLAASNGGISHTIPALLSGYISGMACWCQTSPVDKETVGWLRQHQHEVDQRPNLSVVVRFSQLPNLRTVKRAFSIKRTQKRVVTSVLFSGERHRSRE
jgi:hypothetical protein